MRMFLLMPTIPHPIPYQGSKRHLAQTIMDYFPADATRLIEPFAGSAAVSLAAASQGMIQQFVLNDINKPLINLWNEVIHHPDTLAKYYEHLWQAQQGRERRFYDAVRTRFNKTHHAYYFLYLLARCVKAAVRYNARGEFNQSPDNRRKGRQPQAMREDVCQSSMLFKGKATLFSQDYREVLDMSNSGDIVYMDPPYQGVYTKRDPRYIGGISHEEFVDALNNLNRRGISYIISYDGRTGNKSFGKKLPESLNLAHIELQAGRSSQATLLGRDDYTYESLYLSEALMTRIKQKSASRVGVSPELSLFGETA